MSGNMPVAGKGFVPNELDRWFVDEVLIHEAALTSYVSRGWANASEVPDICQETFMRISSGSARRSTGSSVCISWRRCSICWCARTMSCSGWPARHEPLLPLSQWMTDLC